MDLHVASWLTLGRLVGTGRVDRALHRSGGDLVRAEGPVLGGQDLPRLVVGHLNDDGLSRHPGLHAQNITLLGQRAVSAQNLPLAGVGESVLDVAQIGFQQELLRAGGLVDAVSERQRQGTPDTGDHLIDIRNTQLQNERKILQNLICIRWEQLLLILQARLICLLRFVGSFALVGILAADPLNVAGRIRQRDIVQFDQKPVVMEDLACHRRSASVEAAGNPLIEIAQNAFAGLANQPAALRVLPGVIFILDLPAVGRQISAAAFIILVGDMIDDFVIVTQRSSLPINCGIVS